MKFAKYIIILLITFLLPINICIANINQKEIQITSIVPVVYEASLVKFSIPNDNKKSEKVPITIIARNEGNIALIFTGIVDIVSESKEVIASILVNEEKLPVNPNQEINLSVVWQTDNSTLAGLYQGQLLLSYAEDKNLTSQANFHLINQIKSDNLFLGIDLNNLLASSSIKDNILLLLQLDNLSIILLFTLLSILYLALTKEILSVGIVNLYIFLNLLLKSLIVAGLILSIANYYYFPNNQNLLFLIIYSVVDLYCFFLFILSQSNTGRVVNYLTNQLLQNSVIKIYNKHHFLIKTAISNNKGEFKFRLLPGKYQIIINHSDYKQYNGILSVNKIMNKTNIYYMKKI